MRQFNTLRTRLKKGLLIGGLAALIVATPISVAAHGNNDGDRGRGDNRRSSQQDESARRGDDDYRGRHSDQHNKHWPPVDPATCSEWQTRLNEKVANFQNTAAKDIQFGADYTVMVQAFVTSQNLSVENYDAILANVEAKKIAATNAAEALQAPDLNCENDAAENTERGFDRSGWGQAKHAMEEYKQSLRQLTEAVRDSYGGDRMF